MDMTRSLLLNASYEPHDIIRDRDAIGLILDNDAEMIEHSGEYFRSESLAIPVPSVLRLVKYVVMPEKHRSVLLSTRAVLARDDYECAYCGLAGLTTGSAGNGTMDHIGPRALGGKHVWTNVVASCKKCNLKKGAQRLEDIGWVLRFQPFRPIGASAYLLSMRPEEGWLPYLGVAA